MWLAAELDNTRLKASLSIWIIKCIMRTHRTLRHFLHLVITGLMIKFLDPGFSPAAGKMLVNPAACVLSISVNVAGLTGGKELDLLDHIQSKFNSIRHLLLYSHGRIEKLLWGFGSL
jgi:hypothetical protein